jgi:hypothetical protein
MAGQHHAAPLLLLVAVGVAPALAAAAPWLAAAAYRHLPYSTLDQSLVIIGI